MKVFFYLFVGLFIQQISAQKETIKGFVKSENEAVPFAEVYFKNSKIGTVTDINGYFELKIPANHAILTVQAVGFKKWYNEIHLNELNQRGLNINLEEDVLGLDQIVVTATRNKINRKYAPVIVSVTSNEVLEKTQSLSMIEGLNFQPGLRTETNCQNCGFSQVRINGLNGAYSQILIDNKPIFSALNGVYGLEQLPTSIVERIELVRGGGSSLYGSNAIAGTINIITKEPNTNSFEFGNTTRFLTKNQTDHLTSINGSFISEERNFGAHIFGTLRNREATDFNGDSYSELTQIRAQTFGFKGFLKPKNHHKLSFELHYLNEFRRGGNKLHLLAHESNVTEQIDSDILMTGLTYEWASNDLKNFWSVYTSLSSSKNNNFYGGRGEEMTPNIFSNSLEESLLGYGNSKDDTFVAGLQWSNNTENFFGLQNTFTSGLEFKHNNMSDQKPGIGADISQKLNILGVYAQNDTQINKKFKLVYGLRLDHHNLTEDNWILNPRMHALYNISERWQLRGGYSKGYRAPQIFSEDVHSSIAAGELTRILVDTEKLKTETSHSFTSSVEWSKKQNNLDLFFSLEGFYTLLKDPFILTEYSSSSINQIKYPKPNEGMTWVKENGVNGFAKGLNIETKIASKKWDLQLGATIQKSQYENIQVWSEDPDLSDDVNAKNFFKAPFVYGNAILNYQINTNHQITLSGVYTGSMYVPHIAGAMGVDADKLVKTSDFLDLGLVSNHQSKIKNLDLMVNWKWGVQNILNAFQTDLDKGPNRDANYIYGPKMKRTYFVGIKIGSL